MIGVIALRYCVVFGGGWAQTLEDKNIKGCTMSRRRLPILGLAVLVGLLVLTACSLKFTGGGWVVSGLDPNKKATFGFTYDATAAKIKGSYHNHGSNAAFPRGVALKFYGPMAPTILGGLFDNCMGATVSYTSLDPKSPGSGTLRLEACDNGEPGGSDDLFILVLSGPYAGPPAYSTFGILQGGNLTAH